MKELEQTLDSREVAKMVEKAHSELLKDMRRYISQFNEGKIPYVDFFREDSYKDRKGEIRPCYRITKKGCEFIAHKLTGIKGTIFTARYINRFHEMEEKIKGIEPGKPWFVRRFRGHDIILWRDFISITGCDIEKRKPQGWADFMIGGRDFNGYGWKCNNAEFRRRYGFDYGEEPCMMYFYMCGIRKVIRLLENDRKFTITRSQKTLLNTITGKALEEKPQIKSKKSNKPVPIQIVINMEPDKALNI